MYKAILVTAAAVAMMLSGCADRSALTVTISNDSDVDRTEVVELQAESVLKALKGEYCYVADESGDTVVSQITHDGKLIFPVNVGAHSGVTYTVRQAESELSYASVAVGRKYPERADDVAWENDLVGFRAYGPATQAKGEKAYGYDIFFKHPTAEPILEKLYAPETSPLTWHKVDSLRKIDKALAEEFIKTFSYHIDHGMGMDCYAVGPTLGAGVAAIMDNDTIVFPWCYADAEVLDNGPLRFTAKMSFTPKSIGVAAPLTEQRLISLDAGSHLNKCRVWYDGQDSTYAVVAGFPRRDDSEALINGDGSGMIAYADPTQGPDNGRAMLGLVMPALEPDSIFEQAGHILMATTLAPSDTLTYYWGFAWDKADIDNMTDWEEYLNNYTTRVNEPLRITIR